MSPYDKQRAFSALIALIAALFVSNRFIRDARWRARWRAATIGLFAVALLAAFIEIGAWLTLK